MDAKAYLKELKWTKDRPKQTVLDVFKKEFPNYKPVAETIYPLPCPSGLDERYEEICKGKDYNILHCVECWNQIAIVETLKGRILKSYTNILKSNIK